MTAPFTQSNVGFLPQQKRRRIPGPVGQSLWCQNSKASSAKNAKNEREQAHDQNKTQRTSNRQGVDGNMNSNADACNNLNNKVVLDDPCLWKGPWLTACLQNGVTIECERNKLYMTKNDSFLFHNHCGAIKQRVSELVFRIPKLIVLVKTLSVSEDGFAVLMDPFGSVFATLTNRVMSQHSAIGVGCVLVLSNVVVRQAERDRFYVNVIMDNIHRIYSTDTGVPYGLKETLRKFRKHNIATKHHQTAQNPRRKQKQKNDYYDKGIVFADSKKQKPSSSAEIAQSATKEQKLVQSVTQNKSHSNESSDDDMCVIGELDMYETPHGGKAKAVRPITSENGNGDGSDMLMQPQVGVSPLKKNENIQSKSPGPMNIFKDMSQTSKNEQIPKGLNLAEELFSQLEEGFFFEDEK